MNSLAELHAAVLNTANKMDSSTVRCSSCWNSRKEAENLVAVFRKSEETRGGS
jgi:hypothetical protein